MTFRQLLLVALLFLIPENTTVKFTTIDQGATSQIETPRTTVVKTAAEWAALWKEHAGETKPQPPAVDFSKSMVLGVFSGTKPTAAHAVEITQVDVKDGTMVVTYREQPPPADAMVAQVLTMPFHIVRTDAHAGKVVFQRAKAAR